MRIVEKKRQNNISTQDFCPVYHSSQYYIIIGINVNGFCRGNGKYKIQLSPHYWKNQYGKD